MLKVPLLAPVAVGVNVTLTVQFAPVASGLVQVLVCAKAPVVVMVPMFRGIVCVLVTVNLIGALVVPTFWVGKVSVDCERVTPVAGPITGTVWGLPGSLLMMLSPPSTLPEVSGEKVNCTAQLAPAAKLVPQVFVWAKFPTAAMLVIVIAVVPRFLRVTVLDGLVDPMVPWANCSVSGDIDNPVPIPVRAVFSMPTVPVSMTVKVPVREPMAVGLKDRLSTQELPTAKEVPHVLEVMAKSPVVAMLLKVMDAAWSLAMVIFRPGLAVFKACHPKYSLPADTIEQVRGVRMSGARGDCVKSKLSVMSLATRSR